MFLLLAGSLAVAGRSAAQTSQVRITVLPQEALMDEVVQIKVLGLPPNAMVTIRASLSASDRQRWQSSASFQADSGGIIDLSGQAPVSGTYSGADPMGLFWSMSADPNSKEGETGFLPTGHFREPVVTVLQAEQGGRVVASAESRRWFLRPAVRVTEIGEAGLVALLFEPAPSERRPVIIVLGGSEGGYPESEAALFASHGYTALALAYFGLPGLPGELRNIPLECVQKALVWLRTRPSVDQSRIAIVGGSRGSELALSAAAQYSELRAVVAMKPSHVVWEGTSARGYPDGPSFTVGGKPLPYLKNHISVGFGWHYVGHWLSKSPLALTPMFLDSLADRESAARAEIPVERINGPVLFLSGKDDQLWPSSLMAEKALARLKQHHHVFDDQHIAYEGVGHFIPTAWVPLAGSRRGLRFSIGGNAPAGARACADAQKRILAFLQAALSR